MIEMKSASEYFGALKAQARSLNLMHQAKENRERKRQVCVCVCVNTHTHIHDVHMFIELRTGTKVFSLSTPHSTTWDNICKACNRLMNKKIYFSF